MTKKKIRDLFVLSNERKQVARPVPPFKDRRTNRQRTRGDELRARLREEQ